MVGVEFSSNVYGVDHVRDMSSIITKATSVGLSYNPQDNSIDATNLGDKVFPLASSLSHFKRMVPDYKEHGIVVIFPGNIRLRL